MSTGEHSLRITNTVLYIIIIILLANVFIKTYGKLNKGYVSYIIFWLFWTITIISSFIELGWSVYSNIKDTKEDQNIIDENINKNPKIEVSMGIFSIVIGLVVPILIAYINGYIDALKTEKLKIWFSPQLFAASYLFAITAITNIIMITTGIGE